jgi:hypothetical protein
LGGNYIIPRLSAKHEKTDPDRHNSNGKPEHRFHGVLLIVVFKITHFRF